MNTLKISTLLALLATLSGCMTSSALNNSIDKSKKERHTPTHTDSVIAISKPTTPIQDYDNALVLVGQRYSYLVQPDGDNGDTLLKIFETVDLKNLSLSSYSYTFDIKQAHDDWTCTSSHGCANIGLKFSKSSNNHSNSTKSYEEKTQDLTQLYEEKAQLENLGFDCKVYDHKDTNVTCWYFEKLAFIITDPIKNSSQPTHQLSKPATLQFYQFDADHDKKSIATKKALQPLAFAFDIITFPIQMLIWNPDK